MPGPPAACRLAGRLSGASSWFSLSQQSVEGAFDVIDQASFERPQQETESYMEPDFRIGHVHLAIET